MYIFSLKYRHCLYFYGARKPPKRWRRCPDLAGCVAVGVAPDPSGRLWSCRVVACSGRPGYPARRRIWSPGAPWRVSLRPVSMGHGYAFRSVSRAVPATVCAVCARLYNRCVRVFASAVYIYNNTAVIFNKRQRYFICSFNKSKKHEKKWLTGGGNRAIMVAQEKKQQNGEKNNEREKSIRKS